MEKIGPPPRLEKGDAGVTGIASIGGVAFSPVGEVRQAGREPGSIQINPTQACA